jgi:hypothetical protein
MTSTVPEGIRGNSGIVATFDADDLDGNIKAMRLVTEDKDDADLTFAEAASGETKDYKLNVTAIQSTAAGSLWRLVWDEPAGEFAVVYGPHGNAVPTVEKPHFLFTAKAQGRPEIGKEASLSKTRADFEYVFDVTSAIVLDDGAP